MVKNRHFLSNIFFIACVPISFNVNGVKLLIFLEPLHVSVWEQTSLITEVEINQKARANYEKTETGITKKNKETKVMCIISVTFL